MSQTELPPLGEGVVYLGGPHEVNSLGLPVLQVSYRVHGLHVVIGWTMAPPNYFKEPDRLVISPEGTIMDFLENEQSSGEVEEAIGAMYGGISTAVLRAIPMAHARAVLRGPYERRIVDHIRERVTPLPPRVESDEEYVHVAVAYVDLIHGHAKEPIQRLFEWTDTEPGTWSARLRRARSKGILVGKGHQTEISSDYKNLEERLRSSWLAKSVKTAAKETNKSD